jgi:hypothetical protein
MSWSVQYSRMYRSIKALLPGIAVLALPLTLSPKRNYVVFVLRFLMCVEYKRPLVPPPPNVSMLRYGKNF